MVTFIKLRVECSMNRNSSMSVTVIDPDTTQQAQLVEGADIVIPLFDGIAFSGEITRVNKKQMTPEGVPNPVYMWEIEATSDMIKLKNIALPSNLIGSFVGYTAGQLIAGFVGNDWNGDIDLGGPVCSFTTTGGDKSTFVNDLLSQTGYDFKTRREYTRFESTAYEQKPANPPYIDVPYSAMGVSDTLVDGEFQDDVLLFVTGRGAFITSGTIFYNYTNVVYAILDHPELPTHGDAFIIVQNPKLDAKPMMSEGAPVKNLNINEQLLNFTAIDDKSERYTKIICTGRNRMNAAVSSTLAAVLKDESQCTYTAFRADGVLYQDGIKGTNAVIVRGRDIKPAAGEGLSIRTETSWATYLVSTSSNTFGANGEPTTKIVFTTNLAHTYPAGSPIYYENSKIYVEDSSVLTSPVWIGDEKIAFNSKGTDANGSYIGGVVRGQSGGSPGYDHPIGVLVRNNTYSESNPEPGSPFAEYGERINTVNTSAAVSRGDLDRLCTTMLPRGSNIINTGEGSVPLNFFWKITNNPDPGYVPLEVGDTVTVSSNGSALGNYLLQSYTIDFDKCMVTVRLGDYDQGIIFKIHDLQNTLQRQLS